MSNNYPPFGRLDSNNNFQDQNVNVAQGQMNIQPVVPESEPFNPNNPYGPKTQDAPINSSHMNSKVFNPSGDMGLSCQINSDQMKSQKPMNNPPYPVTNNSPGAPPYNPSSNIGLSCPINSDQMKNNNYNQTPNKVNNNMMPPNIIPPKMNTPMMQQNMNTPQMYSKEKYNNQNVYGYPPTMDNMPQVIPVPVPVYVPTPIQPVYPMIPPFMGPMCPPPDPFMDPMMDPFFPPGIPPPPPFDDFYY